MDDLSPNQDYLWMMRAVELARRGVGTTSPNPPVGAVIVRDGFILGEGHHEIAGELHAERRAIDNAHWKGNGQWLKGSTIYVGSQFAGLSGSGDQFFDIFRIVWIVDFNVLISFGVNSVISGDIDGDTVNSVDSGFQLIVDFSDHNTVEAAFGGSGEEDAGLDGAQTDSYKSTHL